MAGREKVKVYLYDSKGKYIKSYEHISEFAVENNISKTVFSNKTAGEIQQLENGNIASLNKIGRQGVRDFLRYRNSPYTSTYRGRKISEGSYNGKCKVEVYNLDGEKVAEFKNSYFCETMMNLFHIKRRKEFSRDGLRFEIVTEIK